MTFMGPQLLAEGKGVIARWGPEEALGKSASRRTETSYEAGVLYPPDEPQVARPASAC